MKIDGNCVLASDHLLVRRSSINSIGSGSGLLAYGSVLMLFVPFLASKSM